MKILMEKREKRVTGPETGRRSRAGISKLLPQGDSRHKVRGFGGYTVSGLCHNQLCCGGGSAVMQTRE